MYDYIKILLPCGIAWVIAQVTKVIIAAAKKEKADILVSGGMPSSHTAVVMALVMRIGFLEGFDSGLFTIALVFSIVTMFDAANVRLSVGMQTMRLNQLIRDFYVKDKEKAEEIKVIKGHTYKEVAVGLILGIAVSGVFELVEHFILG